MFVTEYSWNVRCDLTRATVTPHQRWNHGGLFSCLSIGLIYPHFSYRNVPVVDPASMISRGLVIVRIQSAGVVIKTVTKT